MEKKGTVNTARRKRATAGSSSGAAGPGSAAPSVDYRGVDLSSGKSCGRRVPGKRFPANEGRHPSRPGPRKFGPHHTDLRSVLSRAPATAPRSSAPRPNPLLRHMPLRALSGIAMRLLKAEPPFEWQRWQAEVVTCRDLQRLGPSKPGQSWDQVRALFQTVPLLDRTGEQK